MTTNNWADGIILTADGQQWFVFTATSTIQCLHIKYGTINAIYGQLYDTDVIGGFSTPNSNGYNIPARFPLVVGERYFIMIESYIENRIGTYQIAISTSVVPPGTTVTPITANTWANGNIIPGVEAAQWFSFTPSLVTNYFHVGFETLTSIVIYSSLNNQLTGPNLFSGSNNMGTLTLSPGQVYYFMILPNPVSARGTFRVAINTSTTPPP